MIFLGVNTGTSADAVDCVACEFMSGQQQFLHGVSVAIPDRLQKKIVSAVEAEALNIADCLQMQTQLTDIYVQAVNLLISELGVSREKIVAIGLHGQTIHHRPDLAYPYSLQLEDAHQLMNAVNISVVDHFRATDIAYGGQGAPLIPVYHQYLLSLAKHEYGVFLNLGGIANVTAITPQTVKGWDVGPANALMDLWCQQQCGRPYDDRGYWAKSGKVIDSLLEKWLEDAYFERSLPKSTGKDYFTTQWIQQFSDNGWRAEDVQATLCALTVESIRRDIEKHAERPASHGIYVYGKGIHNLFLMSCLENALPSKVRSSEVLGMAPEWLEGGLFAWLAYCYNQSLPLDLTGVTGARRPAVLGSCVKSSVNRAIAHASSV